MHRKKKEHSMLHNNSINNFHNVISINNCVLNTSLCKIKTVNQFVTTYTLLKVIQVVSQVYIESRIFCCLYIHRLPVF